MENLKKRIEDVFEEYENRVKTTSFCEFEQINSRFNSNGWFIQMLNIAINQTLEKFKDFHFNNVKTVESLTTFINS